MHQNMQPGFTVIIMEIKRKLQPERDGHGSANNIVKKCVHGEHTSNRTSGEEPGPPFTMAKDCAN